MPLGPRLILGTALATLALLQVGRAVQQARPEVTPASSDAQLEAERRWAADPERRRLAALLLVSRRGDQARARWQLLAGQGWGSAPLAPVAIKLQALAAESLGRPQAADNLWQQLQNRFPSAAATADALYALGRRQPERRQELLARFPAHPAALAAALEQATAATLPPRQRRSGALHLAQFGPRWPGARAVIEAACLAGPPQAAPQERRELALGLARLGEGAKALACLGGPATGLQSADDLLTLGSSLLQATDATSAQQAAGRAALKELLRRWPTAPQSDTALRVLAEDPSEAGLALLETLPSRWRRQAPVAARLALAGHADADAVLSQWPQDPASWELRWQLARRGLLQGRWPEVRHWLELPAGSRWPTPLAARQRFWLAYSLHRLGEGPRARRIWQQLLAEDGGGYYGWRASVQLGDRTLSGRMTPAAADAQIARLARPAWTPLMEAPDGLERLWQAGQSLEAWELWRDGRRGQAAISGDALRLEGLLRLGIGDDGQGLEQLERAARTLPAPSCRRRQQLETGLHPLRFAADFRAAAAGNGLNPALLLGVAKAESQFLPGARSPVGAIGLLQLMPDTARELARGPLPPGSLESPALNSRLGARYLDQLLRHWQGDLLAAVASYNAGAGAVAGWDPALRQREPERWVERIPYPETRLYVKKVLGNAWSYQRGARLGCAS